MNSYDQSKRLSGKDENDEYIVDTNVIWNEMLKTDNPVLKSMYSKIIEERAKIDEDYTAIDLYVKHKSYLDRQKKQQFASRLTGSKTR